MSKEIFLDGGRKPSHCPSMELNTIVTIYLRQPWSHWHSSFIRAYWRHNTELNARWVSTDNCERHETFSQFSPQDRRASYRPDLKLNQPYKKKQGSKKKLYIDKLRDKGAFI